MPRRGENIYKRKDGRWEGRILKEDGKYQSIYAKSYGEVREKKKNLQTANKIQKINLKSIHPIKGLFESWLASDVIQYVKPSTYEYYYRCIHQYVIPFFEKNKYQQLTELTIHAFVKSIKINPSLSEGYKRKILSVFKTALRKILMGSPEYSIINDAVKLPALENKEIQVFTRIEQKRIEDAIMHDSNHRAFGILLSFYTGIRLGELCALKWGDFDLEARTMDITKTVSRVTNFKEGANRTELLVGVPKSAKSYRKIPVPEFLINLLEKYWIHRNENHYILSGSQIPMEPRTYQKLYKRVLVKAGVRYRKFHAIRHTFATRSLELGVDIKTLSEILGHSNVSITLNIYAHSLLEQKKIAMDKLNDMHTAFMKSSPYAVNNIVIHSNTSLNKAYFDY